MMLQERLERVDRVFRQEFALLLARKYGECWFWPALKTLNLSDVEKRRIQDAKEETLAALDLSLVLRLAERHAEDLRIEYASSIGMVKNRLGDFREVRTPLHMLPLCLSRRRRRCI